MHVKGPVPGHAEVFRLIEISGAGRDREFPGGPAVYHSQDPAFSGVYEKSAVIFHGKGHVSHPQGHVPQVGIPEPHSENIKQQKKYCQRETYAHIG